MKNQQIQAQLNQLAGEIEKEINSCNGRDWQRVCQLEAVREYLRLAWLELESIGVQS